MTSFLFRGRSIPIPKPEKKIKSAAQGLITLATYGVGMLIGFWVAGQIADIYLISEGVHSWKDIWIFPAGFAVVVLILFSLLFKNEKIEYKAS